MLNPICVTSTIVPYTSGMQFCTPCTTIRLLQLWRDYTQFSVSCMQSAHGLASLSRDSHCSAVACNTLEFLITQSQGVCNASHAVSV